MNPLAWLVLAWLVTQLAVGLMGAILEGSLEECEAMNQEVRQSMTHLLKKIA